MRKREREKEREKKKERQNERYRERERMRERERVIIHQSIRHKSTHLHIFYLERKTVGLVCTVHTQRIYKQVNIFQLKFRRGFLERNNLKLKYLIFTLTSLNILLSLNRIHMHLILSSYCNQGLRYWMSKPKYDYVIFRFCLFFCYSETFLCIQ